MGALDKRQKFPSAMLLRNIRTLGVSGSEKLLTELAP